MGMSSESETHGVFNTWQNYQYVQCSFDANLRCKLLRCEVIRLVPWVSKKVAEQCRAATSWDLLKSAFTFFSVTSSSSNSDLKRSSRARWLSRFLAGETGSRFRSASRNSCRNVGTSCASAVNDDTSFCSFFFCSRSAALSADSVVGSDFRRA